MSAANTPASHAPIATVECLTDESGTGYCTVLRVGRVKLYGKFYKREAAARRVAKVINDNFSQVC